jgi:hypothetical protein
MQAIVRHLCSQKSLADRFFTIIHHLTILEGVSMKHCTLAAILALLIIPASPARVAATPEKIKSPDGSGQPARKKIWAMQRASKQPAGLSSGEIRAKSTSLEKNGLTAPGISLFPYQDPLSQSTSFQESFPVTLGNGDLLVVWASAYGDSLYSAKSTDNGINWSARSFVNPVQYHCNDLCGIRTPGGRIVAVWQNNFTGLVSCHSDNEGASWSAPASIGSDVNARYTTLTQTLDGTLWLSYSRNNTSTGSDIFYRTSADSGTTWSDEYVFLASSANEYYASIISKDSSTLLAIYESNFSGVYDLYIKSSTDAGVSWSPQILINDSLSTDIRPRVLRQSNGLLWLIFQHYSPSTGGYSQSDIYFTTSSNGGGSWATPSAWTNYAGYDGWLNGCLKNNKPFVTFASYRWDQFLYCSRIWQGLIGVSVEGNIPPTLAAANWASPAQNREMPILAYVATESAISDVRLFYHLNGVPHGPVQMYDDGLHNDGSAGDDIWGASIGPFQLGDVGDFSIDMTDVSTNEVDVFVTSFSVAAVHDTGNVVLRIGDNSELADNGVSLGTSAQWPKSGSYAYLYDGGLWIGCTVGEQNLVMAQQYGQSDWHRTGGTPFTLAPGISDQDCEVTYDDQFTIRMPIGLRVRQQSYQWSAAGRDDFIVFRYTVKNLSGSALSNIFVGSWLDFDVAEQTDCTKNLGGYDDGRRLLYMYNSTGSPSGFIGVRLLSTTNAPHTAYVYSSIDDPAFGDDDAAYQLMTHGGVIVPGSADDYRVVLTAPPFSLAPGDSSTVAFGIVLGDGLAGLRMNADSMEAVYTETFPSGSSDPVFSSSRASLQFGNIYAGGTKIDSIQVKNIGWNPLDIDSAATMTGDFSVTPAHNRVVNRSDSATYVITFSPAVAGSKKDTLRLYTNASGSPHKIPLSGTALVTGLENQEGSIPAEYAIQQNYPNPFNPETTIGFELPEASAVTILITDVLGRRVETLIDETLPAGYHAVRWNGSNAEGQKAASGIYFYRITASGVTGKKFARALKMTLTK